MKRAFCVVLAVIAALMSLGAARAQIRTVILSDHNEPTFKVSADDAPTVTAEFKFPVGLVSFPAGARVEHCLLRVVPTPQGKLPSADQDVTVLVRDTQVGQWSAYSKTLEPYTTELEREAWAPGSGGVLKLKTESKHTAWDYFGGRAATIAYQPRLIVTYNLPSSPVPAGSGQASFSSTSWTLPKDATALANPVSYEGALYQIAGTADARLLYRVAAGESTKWKLDFPITDGSFAFVTAWGRLQIITENAIGSCDLEKLGPPDSVLQKPACVFEDPNITVEANETPAMGPDGSLYFRNVDADGCIVAYNPSLQEIWRTELYFTKVSPISLSANGHHAYVLADFGVEEEGASNGIALLCIDTATGETVTQEVKYESTPGQEVAPRLTELLPPAVASKGNVDYVFVAGNTKGTGIFQLVAFEPSVGTFERPDGKPPKVLWSRLGKVAKHELSGADRFSLFAFGDNSVNLYPFDSSLDWAVEEAVRSVGRAGVLLSDGAVPLYMFDTNDLVKRMTELERERAEAKAEAEERRGEKEQLEKALDEADERLAEKEQELAELNKQISRARTCGVVWGMGIAGVMIGACLLLTCWIVRRRKEKTGRA